VVGCLHSIGLRSCALDGVQDVVALLGRILGPRNSNRSYECSGLFELPFTFLEFGAIEPNSANNRTAYSKIFNGLHGFNNQIGLISASYTNETSSEFRAWTAGFTEIYKDPCKRRIRSRGC
jgi:hypothetical protein